MGEGSSCDVGSDTSGLLRLNDTVKLLTKKQAERTEASQIQTNKGIIKNRRVSWNLDPHETGINWVSEKNVLAKCSE